MGDYIWGVFQGVLRGILAVLDYSSCTITIALMCLCIFFFENMSLAESEACRPDP